MGNRFSLLTNARHVNTDYLVYSMMSLVSSAAAETQLQCRGAADQKMSKRLERTLRGGLVSRDSSETGMMADVVINNGSTVKKKMVATVRKNQRKERGKRSSQQNRGISFDFGI